MTESIAVGFDIATWRTRRLQRLEARLDQALPAAGTLPPRLHEAMRYAMQGGKRLRALLIYACGDLLDAPGTALDACAAAMELLHAYSLVHDDLPCMDDDDLRRGQPTVHRAWDEATAVLVGDALQTAAFEHLAHPLPEDAANFDGAARLHCVRILAQAAGSRGMCGGQMMDLEAESRAIDIAELESLHVHKTGELILACARMAAICSPQATSARVEAIERAVKHLGLAFQIQDDLLDNDGTTETLGKTSGKDRIAGKATFPGLLGVHEARRRVDALFEEARASLANHADGSALRSLIDEIEQRRA
ncbi:polyprenyl synthetase family protein [Algiphilus sp. NNCM1]|uniref:polyprenyl synthetase family protein n=1 Tax=Algiphilus sp. TaxID=1872431 RepID=UPI001CA67520|nr:farnesyl diphosphate synthase [Algiphilus sp.]MBY8965770.1 polyprenyl synthetase family protein [Algiphilus acroporae]MCI5102979.1 polyprenyl synthetase family protein [Algiphilus sp.]